MLGFKFLPSEKLFRDFCTTYAPRVLDCKMSTSTAHLQWAYWAARDRIGPRPLCAEAKKMKSWAFHNRSYLLRLASETAFLLQGCQTEELNWTNGKFMPFYGKEIVLLSKATFCRLMNIHDWRGRSNLCDWLTVASLGSMFHLLQLWNAT